MSSLSMVLPKIETDATSKNYGRYVIGPLERGYGITLGNALRRVLLSSLPGAAVTSVRVSDVHHEFSDIPHVREDMTLVILQIKQLRVKLHGEEPVRLRLEVRGEGTVTAGDIQCPPEVEIINPDLYLFTVDSDKANYDKLIMEVWTDGTMRPQEALSQSARILVQHFSLVAGVTEEIRMEEIAQSSSAIPQEIYETPIEQLDLSVRVRRDWRADDGLLDRLGIN